MTVCEYCGKKLDYGRHCPGQCQDNGKEKDRIKGLKTQRLMNSAITRVVNNWMKEKEKE